MVGAVRRIAGRVAGRQRTPWRAACSATAPVKARRSVSVREETPQQAREAVSPVVFDTNVVSELVRPRPEPKVVAFVRAQTEPLLSVITVHELIYGAERAPPARRAELMAWIAALRAQFAGRIVAISEDVAAEAGRLRAAAEAQGRPREAIDALIAACAVARGASVATRNAGDFQPMGVPAIDPWRT
jgi:predicted nucleic acid-binding protein